MASSGELKVSQPSRIPPSTKAAFASILLTQAVIALWIGLPGQLSVDSVVELYEGRAQQFISIHPPFFSILLGGLDRLGSGPIGFVLISQALLSASTWIVLASANDSRLWRIGLATIFLLNPVILIYVGIVWKDVLLAHAVVLTYLLLARLRERALPLTPSQTILILALLITMVGVRQQGVLFAIPAAVWAAMLMRRSRIATVLAALLLASIPIAISMLASSYAQANRASEAAVGSVVGLKVLVNYDLVGILANHGTLSGSMAPDVLREMQNESLDYSVYHVDTLTSPAINYWLMPLNDTVRIWIQSIGTSPAAYLTHRARNFLSLLGMGDNRQCLLVFSGISGPVIHPLVGRDIVAVLGLTPGPTHATPLVQSFGYGMANTPIFMHVAYAAVLVLLSVMLLKRGERVLLTLSICSLLLLGSFAIFGIACDFRYAYTLTVTTCLLAARVALTSSKTGSASWR